MRRGHLLCSWRLESGHVSSSGRNCGAPACVSQPDRRRRLFRCQATASSESFKRAGQRWFLCHCTSSAIPPDAHLFAPEPCHVGPKGVVDDPVFDIFYYRRSDRGTAASGGVRRQVSSLPATGTLHDPLPEKVTPGTGCVVFMRLIIL